MVYEPRLGTLYKSLRGYVLACLASDGGRVKIQHYRMGLNHELSARGCP